MNGRSGTSMVLVAGVLAAAAFGVLAARAIAAQGDEAAGSASACETCHEELAGTFAESPHGRAFRFGEAARGECASCHGGTAEHAVEGATPADVVNPAHAGAEAVNGRCLECHGATPSHGYWSGSAHDRAGLSCADCHAVHAATPPRRPGTIESEPDLCTSCHLSLKKNLTQRSHHPLREGLMTCSSCHDLHGSGTQAALRADSPNDQCLSCHDEKRGPFLWEHSPVKEDCLTCHKPHGSNHEDLLVARTAQLCQSCHLQGRHQTVAGTETGMWYVSRQCVNCHSQIHGSNHPSGPLFMR